MSFTIQNDVNKPPTVMAGGLFLCIKLTESPQKGKRFTYAGLGNSAR